jgi:hypothetical protein
MVGKLIRCTECNAIINMTEGDFYPYYAWNNRGELKKIKMDDRKAFLQQHKGHKTEKLTPLTSPISDKPYSEPLKTSYFEATNGTERFLIKRWRSKIDDPFAYEIIEGSIEIRNGRVRTQTAAIKKQIKVENNSFISETKLNCFIQAVRKEVEKLDPEDLEISAEGETPLVCYYHLGDDCVDRILTQCQDTLNQHELKLLKDFITQHNEYDGVMTVVSKKEFAIKRNSKGRDTKNCALCATQYLDT